MRKDCFAFKEMEQQYGEDECTVQTCTALKKLVCLKKKDCPFYRNIDEYRSELMRLNGTVAMDDILEAYAEKKAKEYADATKREE